MLATACLDQKTLNDMAITFDNFLNQQTSGPTDTSLTFAYTTAGSDRYLVVFVYLFAGDNCTGVTYNGVAMTQLQKTGTPAGSNQHYIYGLAAPASGANNVVISTSVGDTILGYCISYNGAQQTTPADSSGVTTQAAGPTTISTSVTTVADNCWVASMIRNDVAAVTDNTNYVRRNVSSVSVGDTNAALTPAGAKTITAGVDAGGNSSMISAAIAPLVVVAPMTFRGLRGLRPAIFTPGHAR